MDIGHHWTTMANNGQQCATIDNNWQKWAALGNNGQVPAIWTTIRGAKCICDAVFINIILEIVILIMRMEVDLFTLLHHCHRRSHRRCRIDN